MYKPYNNEKLNGRPRFVETRVFHVDQESGEATAVSNIPVFVNNGPHHSDRSYTPFGALERESYYEYLSNSIIAIVCGEYLATFDEYHNITHEEYHYEEPSGKKDDREYTFENEYDGEGRLVRQIGWDNCNNLKHKTVAEFTGNGQMEHKAIFCYLKARERYELTREETYEYDGAGRLVRTLYTNDRGQITSEETRVYDNGGTLQTKTIRHHSWGEALRFTYRKGINYFITIQTAHDEKKIHYRTSLVDAHGNVVVDRLHDRVSTKTADGRWKLERRDTTYRYDYRYDNHGNWMRKDFRLKGEHYYATRKIEYYE